MRCSSPAGNDQWGCQQWQQPGKGRQWWQLGEWQQSQLYPPPPLLQGELSSHSNQSDLKHTVTGVET